MYRVKGRRREREREARKAVWEARRKSEKKLNTRNRDVYGDEHPPDGSRHEPVDGVRMADDLRRLFGLTDDPIFESALLVLRSYGLDSKSPIRNAQRVRDELDWERRDAHEYMTGPLAQAQREGRRISIRDVAERAVSGLGIDGASFESAVDELRHWYSNIEKTGKVPRWDANIGDTGRPIAVRPVEGKVEPAEHLKEIADLNGWLTVPDCRRWRRQAARGRIILRFLGEK